MKDEPVLFTLPPQISPAVARKFRVRNPIWTECKAKLIDRYLYFFILITKHGTYIDAFAGPQEPSKPEMWSAKLVLESTPRWLRNFHLFEQKKSQVKHLEAMIAAQPERDKAKREPKRQVKLYSGDFNQNILKMLSEHPVPDKEASFCLLDQRTFECDWASVKTLATHKTGGNKIELFYFFPEGWINRSIHGRKNEKALKMRKWWGNDDWPKLLKLRGAQRGQHVADRFRTELGYKYAFPFPIYEKKDAGGKIMYYMIHASDHDEAPILMSRAYGKALDKKETAEQMELLKEELHAPSSANQSNTAPLGSASPQ